MGYTVARKGDYYSPLPYVPDLRKNLERWHRPSALTGIDFDLETMKKELANLLGRYYNEFAALPEFQDLKKAGYRYIVLHLNYYPPELLGAIRSYLTYFFGKPHHHPPDLEVYRID